MLGCQDEVWLAAKAVFIDHLLDVEA